LARTSLHLGQYRYFTDILNDGGIYIPIWETCVKEDYDLRVLRVVSAKKTPEYTPEELVVLASIRRCAGRTCRSCAWYVAKGGHKGCWPNGKYRKWLSQKEFESGCEIFSALSEKK